MPPFCLEPFTLDLLAGLAKCEQLQPTDLDHSQCVSSTSEDVLADTHAAVCLSTLMAQGWTVFPSVQMLLVGLGITRGIQHTRCTQLKAALASVLELSMRVRPPTQSAPLPSDVPCAP
jgi:hypothetical protein